MGIQNQLTAKSSFRKKSEDVSSIFLVSNQKFAYVRIGILDENTEGALGYDGVDTSFQWLTLYRVVF